MNFNELIEDATGRRYRFKRWYSDTVMKTVSIDTLKVYLFRQFPDGRLYMIPRAEDEEPAEPVTASILEVALSQTPFTFRRTPMGSTLRTKDGKRYGLERAIDTQRGIYLAHDLDTGAAVTFQQGTDGAFVQVDHKPTGPDERHAANVRAWLEREYGKLKPTTEVNHVGIA